MYSYPFLSSILSYSRGVVGEIHPFCIYLFMNSLTGTNKGDNFINNNVLVRLVVNWSRLGLCIISYDLKFKDGV